jgi:hypothetical protein
MTDHETLRDQAAILGLAEVLEDPQPDEWFYVSFADPDLPIGQQFLGAIYVRGYTLEGAITRAHLLGINPGGEAQAYGPFDVLTLAEHVPEGDRERLLTREETER